MLRAEGVLSVFPELTSAIEVESVVAAGPRIARERVQVFPVCVKTAALLGGVGVEWPRQCCEFCVIDEKGSWGS